MPGIPGDFPWFQIVKLDMNIEGQDSLMCTNLGLEVVAHELLPQMPDLWVLSESVRQHHRTTDTPVLVPWPNAQGTVRGGCKTARGIGYHIRMVTVYLASSGAHKSPPRVPVNGTVVLSSLQLSHPVANRRLTDESNLFFCCTTRNIHVCARVCIPSFRK